MRCYLGLGSNLGDPAGNIAKAVDLLGRRGEVTVLRTSSNYETRPMGYADQPVFVNAVTEVETELTISALFREVKAVEREMGRTKTFHFGPRVIDVDILFCDGEIYQDAEISVPHAGAHTRSFVLYPLQEIAPDFVHPLTGRTVTDLKAKLREDLGIRKT